MLYLIDKYVQEYPDRPLQALEKFKDLPKNLHEMSLAELNDIVKEWNPLTERTAYNQRKSILYYLKWLRYQGIQVNPQIANEIEIPISKRQFLIYSTKDIEYYYNILFKLLEKQAIMENSTFDKSKYYLCYATGILAFYGLTDEQIINLQLSDVQPDGVIGYDLPLTEHDIDILLKYKNVTKFSNNMPLIGTTYVRSTRNASESIDSGFLSRPIWRVKLDDENNYLKSLLRVSNLYKLGLYDKIYQLEKETGQRIEINCITPQWFMDIVNKTKTSAITLSKKDYIEYRAERNSAKPKEPVNISIEDKSKLITRFNELTKQMQDLNNELNSIKDLIKK